MRFLLFVYVVCALVGRLLGQVEASNQDPGGAVEVADFDLEELSLEELMEIPVEVGSRQAQPLGRTAASVFVLNETDIQRSGMRSVPELLRLVPGLIIATDVPGAYSFTSRLGEWNFAGMLILIDGQRLYNTLLEREYWQAVDLPVEIIERIEVVRGPGGSRWGDNASNGVINIVTKRAGEGTQGLLLTGWAGNEEYAGSFRFGHTVSDRTAFYVHGKIAERDGFAPNQSGDRWDNNSVGMRVDSDVAEDVHLTVDGLYHDSYTHDNFVGFDFAAGNRIKGGHIKSKLRVQHDDRHWTEWRLALNGYDQDITDYFMGVRDYQLRYREDLAESMLLHSWSPAENHQVTIGLVGRSVNVELFGVDVSGMGAFDGGSEFNETRGDLFLSWEWNLTERLRVTLGGNISYEDGLRKTGISSQPDLRISWQPQSNTTIWTALSSNRESDDKAPDFTTGRLIRTQQPSQHTWEAGLRHRIGETLLLQVDGFAYEIYDQLTGFATDPMTFENLPLTDGKTSAFGGEIHASWRPREDTRVSAWLAHTEAESRNFSPGAFLIEDGIPRLRGGMTVGFQPVPGLEIDTNVLYTQSWANVPAWWRVDLRLAYRLSDRTMVALVGQNLTDPEHVEYFYDERLQRSGYLLVTHRF